MLRLFKKYRKSAMYCVMSLLLGCMVWPSAWAEGESL